MENIKSGDVVQLKSGGPKMTVAKVGNDTRGTLTAWCDWFEKTTAMHGAFPVTSLRLDQ
jgi:uncharacterized protein YodC (DUF2158 family)